MLPGSLLIRSDFTVLPLVASFLAHVSTFNSQQAKKRTAAQLNPNLALFTRDFANQKIFSKVCWSSYTKVRRCIKDPRTQHVLIKIPLEAKSNYCTQIGVCRPPEWFGKTLAKADRVVRKGLIFSPLSSTLTFYSLKECWMRGMNVFFSFWWHLQFI